MPAAPSVGLHPEPMSDRFVIVHRSYDPIQADILGDLLRDSGITARVTGTRSGAAIGVAQNILEVHIAVPESQAGAATDFLEAYFAAEPIAEPDEQAEDPTEASDEPPEREIRPLLAAGSAFLTFGVGHLYARRPTTAMALLAGQLVAMYFLFAGDDWHDWTTGLTALIAIVACDVVGASLAARAHRNGVRRGATWQIALGAVYVVGSLGLAQLVGPHLADPTVGEPTTGWRKKQQRPASEEVDKPLERDPSFPPLTSEHPANPAARR